MTNIREITEVNEVINNDLAVIIAKSKNCSVCKPVSENLENLMKNYPNVLLYSIYIEELEMFSGQFLVFTVPTILIFSGGKELLRESRFINFSNIKRLLDNYSQK